VDLAARFARSEVTTRVVLDDAGRVRGFWISNPQPPAYTAPDYATPASFEEAELAIAGGAGKPLPATLTLPKGVANPPVVVLVHGSGPNDRDETIGANHPFRDLAWGLASRGVAVLRYDKRTFAHRGELAAPGLTVEQEVVLDALAALAAARADGRVDAHRVYVAGHSLGGTLAPEIAARDGRVAGVILLAASARPLADVTLEQIAYLRSLGGASGTQSDADYGAVVAQLERVRAHALPDDAMVLGATAGYFYDLARRDPVGRARALRAPVFVAQGGRDYQVTDADLAIWRDALGGRAGVTVREYPALNHLFMAGEGKAMPVEYVGRTGHVSRELVDDVSRWVLGAGGDAAGKR
jgi:dienelactone hydrolase